MEFTYKILKKQKDINASLIEKSGMKGEFTIRNLAQEVKEHTKARTETKSNIAICKAILENIKEKHPSVLKLSIEELQVATVYLQKSNYLIALKKELKNIEQGMKNYKNEFPDIKKALNIKDETELDIALTAYFSMKDPVGDVLKKAIKEKNAKK